VIVLDASALLTFLFSEAGHERVAANLDRSCISAVNLSEVIGRFARDGHDAREVLQRINESSIKTVPFLAEDAALAAALVPATRPLGLSLGDRACLALAISRKASAWTADRAWAPLDIGVSIEVIR
jgi:PIN domain nuclease of toxin-antitoxin system